MNIAEAAKKLLTANFVDRDPPLPADNKYVITANGVLMFRIYIDGPKDFTAWDAREEIVERADDDQDIHQYIGMVAGMLEDFIYDSGGDLTLRIWQSGKPLTEIHLEDTEE